MANKDASIIRSLETNLKESKLVISKKDTSIKTLTKKMKEVGERDAGIIHSLNKDLSEKKKVVDEKDDAIKALESRLAEMEVNLMEKDEVIKTLMRQLEEEKTIVTV